VTPVVGDELVRGVGFGGRGGGAPVGGGGGGAQRWDDNGDKARACGRWHVVGTPLSRSVVV
jgi:hypothetical protein